MVSTLRIVHAPSSDNPTLLPLLVLYVDAKRYMFNLPEGSTRAMAQRGIRGLAKGCGDVFLPSVGTESAGTAGMIMTLSDMGRTKLTLHGPTPLAHMICTMRTYARRDDLELQVNQIHSATLNTPLFKDANVTVHAIVLSSNNSSSSSNDDEQVKTHKRRRFSSPPSRSTSPASSETAIDIARSIFPGASHSGGKRRDPFKPLPSVAAHDLPFEAAPAKALCFIVEHPAQRGKFDNDRATQLGVPLGKARGQLVQKGSLNVWRPKTWVEWDMERKLDWLKQEDKKLKDEDKKKQKKAVKGAKGGKKLESTPQQQQQLPPPEEHEEVVITANEVTGEARLGSLFIQLYVPSVAFLPSLLNETSQARFAQHFADSGRLTPHLVIHAASTEVLTDARYLDFVKRFGPSAHHIISNPDFATDKLAFPSSALAQLRLAQLDSNIWRPHRYALSPKLPLEQLALPNASAASLDVEVPLLPPAPPSARGRESDRDFHDKLDSDATRGALSYVGLVPGTKANAALVQAGREAGWKQFIALADELRPAVAAAEHNETRPPSPDLVITALGTGSAAPSKYRNVSGTLIHVPGGSYMLLDAGESTYAQLKRRFGDGLAHPYQEATSKAAWEPKGGVDEVLRNLRVMFLSHIHGDHHMGVSKILVERRKLNPTQPLYIITTVFIRNYLVEYDAIQPLGLADSSVSPEARHGGVIFLDSEALDFETGVDAHEVSSDGQGMQPVSPKAQDARQLAKLKAFAQRRAEPARLAAQRLRAEQPDGEHAMIEEEEDTSDGQAKKLLGKRVGTRQHVRRHLARCKASLGLQRIATCEVDHRATHCYGLVAWSTPTPASSTPWSLAYSGDTRPCATLVRAAKDVDVLIHEATIEDTEPEMAKAKGHSTFGQAIGVAREMRAKHCLLTHFSQRYPKLPRLSVGMETDDGEEHKMPIAMAFDLLSMPVSDMWKMERYRPAMELLFDADEDDGAEAGEDVVQSKADAVEGDQEMQLAGAEMTVDATATPLVSSLASEAQTPTIAKHGNGVGKEVPPTIERKNVKRSEFAFLLLELTPPRAQRPAPPSAVAVHEACRQSVERMHGLVGGAFVFDVLHVQAMPSSGAQALLRVASEHLSFLCSSLAADLRLTIAGATADAAAAQWRSSVQATSGASGLPHVALSDSRAWLDGVVKRETS